MLLYILQKIDLKSYIFLKDLISHNASQSYPRGSSVATTSNVCMDAIMVALMLGNYKI